LPIDNTPDVPVGHGQQIVLPSNMNIPIRKVHRLSPSCAKYSGRPNIRAFSSSQSHRRMSRLFVKDYLASIQKGFFNHEPHEQT
jgi:hypothetical protein